MSCLDPRSPQAYCANVTTVFEDSTLMNTDGHFRMVKDYIKAVKEIDPQASDKWVMTKPTKAVKPPEKIGTWGELDTKESYKAMKISKDGRAAVKELNKTYVKNYRNDGSEESHARVIAYTKNVRDQLLAATRPPCTGSCGI